MKAPQERTKEMAEIMLAFANGEPLQYRINHAGEWLDYFLTAPRWNWDEHDYRIKPKPRVAREFIAGFTGGGQLAYVFQRGVKQDNSLKSPIDSFAAGEIVLREVLPEDK